MVMLQGDVEALAAHQDAQEAKRVARAERKARAQVRLFTFVAVLQPVVPGV